MSPLHLEGRASSVSPLHLKGFKNAKNFQGLTYIAKSQDVYINCSCVSDPVNVYNSQFVSLFIERSLTFCLNKIFTRRMYISSLRSRQSPSLLHHLY